ncbi:MAG: hypothetical protein ACLFR2_02740 [Candidatus Kapaibacterium sp.]
MEELILPKYQMKLVEKVEKAIWNEYGSYRDVKLYIKKWHEVNGFVENFSIIERRDNNIDLKFYNSFNAW